MFSGHAVSVGVDDVRRPHSPATVIEPFLLAHMRGSVGWSPTRWLRGDPCDLREQQPWADEADLCGINSETSIDCQVAGSGP